MKELTKDLKVWFVRTFNTRHILTEAFAPHLYPGMMNALYKSFDPWIETWIPPAQSVLEVEKNTQSIVAYVEAIKLFDVLPR